MKNLALGFLSLIALVWISLFASAFVQVGQRGIATCVSGFTPQGRDFCRRTTLGVDVWTNATACTGRTFGDSIPAGSYVLMGLHWSALSNNAIGQRANTINFFSDSGCTNLVEQKDMIAREEAAVVAGTVIVGNDAAVVVPLTVADTFYATQANAGGNGNVSAEGYAILGYWMP